MESLVISEAASHLPTPYTDKDVMSLNPKIQQSIAEAAHSLQTLIQKEYEKFQKAWRQVLLLNSQAVEIGARYDRAVNDNLRNYRYLLRLRLCSVEGLRNMYHEYSCRQAEKIADLEANLRTMGVEPIRRDNIH